jgi:hypothetical protein
VSALRISRHTPLSSPWYSQSVPSVDFSLRLPVPELPSSVSEHGEGRGKRRLQVVIINAIARFLLNSRNCRFVTFRFEFTRNLAK